LTVCSRLPRRKPRTAVLLLPPSPSMDRPGSDGSYAEWPLRQGCRRACGRRRCVPQRRPRKSPSHLRAHAYDARWGRRPLAGDLARAHGRGAGRP
jgi:hypothetical protein